MDIHILLTNYLLQFMYGDLVFQDPILLSREVLKKAYQEGLYFVGKKEVIDRILKEKSFPTTSAFVFAGIPTLEEVSLSSFVDPVLYALKLQLPYEVLADFSYDSFVGETVISKKDINLFSYELTPVCFHLEVVDKKPLYVLGNESKSYFLEEEQDFILQYFVHQLKEYQYAIRTNLDSLKERLETFLNSEKGIEYMNQHDLNPIKECYELVA